MALQVVGESYYQDALEQVCGGRCEEGASEEVIAALVLNPDNTWDPNAVSVEVNGKRVGHLPRTAAEAYQPVGKHLAELGMVGVCNAYIAGGWERKRGKDRGHFGISLDLAAPENCLPEGL
ncbi:MAG: HIRAN domain-containing protein [Actinomycetota bacterium]